MGSKREAGRAKRRWEKRVAPAMMASAALSGFLAMANTKPFGDNLSVRAASKVVRRWQDNHCTIYTVDRDLQAEVARGGLPSGAIPVEVFERLPHPAPLFLLADGIAVPDPDGAGKTILYDMFTVSVVSDYVILSSTGQFLPDPQRLLRFVWFGSEAENPIHLFFSTSSISLITDIDLQSALDSVVEDLPSSAGALAQTAESMRGENWEVLNESLFPLAAVLTLYACSQEPDLSPVRPPKTVSSVGQKYKGAGLEIHDLGIRVGAAIRSSRQPASPTTAGSSSRTVTPHMRKAHWHRFWTGPRKGDPSERKLVLRWIPPVAVNADKGNITPTIHPLRPHF